MSLPLPREHGLPDGRAAAGLPDAAALHAAAARLAGEAVATPVRRLDWLSRRLGRPVWAKLEQAQHTGSFKFRGAFNALAQIPRGTTVIAASAGNHSLAVAEAARRTGHAAVLCLPATASPLKRERLAAYDVALVVHGDTLDEATAHARRLAAENGWAFLSPYDDARVVAGQASLGFELFGQLADIETVVVPVGGGGLAAGIGLAAQALGRSVAIVGAQPARFASMARSLAAGRAVRAVFRPSLADGLLVNLDAGATTLDWARRGLAALHLIDEEALAAGCLTLLAREALLCEPSGAIGIAAALDGRLDRLPGRGPVAIVLSGGNMTAGAAAGVLAYPFRRPALLRAVELHHRAPAEEPVLRAPPRPPEETAPAAAETPGDWSQQGLAEELGGALGAACRRLDDFAALPSGRAMAPAEHAFLDSLRRAARALADAAAQPGQSRAARERLIRLGRRASAFVDGAIGWQAAAYDQAVVAPFRRAAEQASPQVNYTRYRATAVEELEDALADTLGLAGPQASVLATSSGMAAVALVQDWLLRCRLAPGDAVVCQPGAYFETLEHYRALPHLRLVPAADDGADALVAAVARHAPRALLVEPLVNTPDLRLLALDRLLARLDAAAGGPLTVVIDGTMLSGACAPFAGAAGRGPVETVYLESAAKYLQAGLDLTMAGLVACPPGERAAFDRIRRNTGAILYEPAAALLPRLARADHLARLRRMTANCLIVGEIVSRHFPADARPGVQPVFPGLGSHPDHAAAAGYAHLGGVMAFRLSPPGLANRWLLEALIEHVLERARREGVALCKGVSFGFSAPRISAAWALSQSSAPFLRLSVGDQGAAETARLAGCLCAGFDGFFRAMAAAGALT
ncbi:pyridoxal-phosphate dependent enzyme [Aquibium sp. A9E412]|uniref:pyridoxal-phosphate dependent enzyme n=1 Tax=Aquibium sp. A9E412 TaxID=2976767 RepID=UPI0025B11489|nr:pyridoxal-phosphate dependent enzyme [Aquibium sp. A9E412]MDN2567974.1 pyridoxal-phosphate dependent enzyme [Aquibium sp. A9E412]